MRLCSINLITLWANSAYDKVMIFLFYRVVSPEVDTFPLNVLNVFITPARKAQLKTSETEYNISYKIAVKTQSGLPSLSRLYWGHYGGQRRLWSDCPDKQANISFTVHIHHLVENSVPGSSIILLTPNFMRHIFTIFFKAY